MLERFEDRELGGFWFTSHDHERLFHRHKPGHDNATPSGNGVAASALVTLGHLMDEPRYLDAAERVVRLFAPTLTDAPNGRASLLIALEDLEAPPTTVLLRGDPRESHEWQRAIERTYRPDVRVLDVAVGASAAGRAGQGRGADAHGAVAWICRGTTCLPPIRSLHELLHAVDRPTARASALTRRRRRRRVAATRTTAVRAVNAGAAMYDSDCRARCALSFVNARSRP